MPNDRAGNSAKRVADTSPGPWRDCRIRTRHGRAIRFIQTYCAAPKGEGWGKPLRLATFQKEFLEAALAPGVGTAVLQTPRGNGKSTFGGALALWALFDDDETGAPQVPIVATTVGQAVKSCYGVARSMIERSPDLRRRSLVFTGIGTSRIVHPYNEGEMFPIANVTGGLQGLDPSLAIVDEIGFQPPEAWASLHLASGKRSRSVIIGVGTPGLDRDNALFALRQRVHGGTPLRGLVFHEYGAPPGCDITDRAAWRTANPAIKARFLRESALADDLAITPEGYFRVFRLGQWYEGVDSWLGASGRAVWEALTSPYEFIDGAPTWVGVDVGIKRDSTAVVAVQRRSDGRLHAICRLWLPTEDEPVDVTDVMAHLRDLDEAYDVRAISYDPRFMDVPAKLLLDEGLPMVEVPQSIEHMTPAIGQTYALIRNGGLTHDGDEAFAGQVLNAVPRMNERGFTLSKPKSRGRIDAAVALALAVDRAEHPAALQESFFSWA